ncbi:MAG: HD domain-containing phosphohydrolase [Planctomycetota bacterium]
MSSRILLVDDEPKVLRALERVLSSDAGDWDVRTAGGAAEALTCLGQTDFDAIVTDVNMPGRDGLALLAEVRSAPRTKAVPVIVVTGRYEDDIKRRALEAGAIDLLNKPVHPQDLLARLRNAVRLKAYEDQLRDQNAVLEQRVAERTAELADSRLDIIWRLGKAAEQRDEQTGHHVVRVGCYCRVLAQTLGLDRDFVETLFLASPLHDIGKIGIPDSVLLKPGPLDHAEREVMKRHCAIGADILREDCRAMRIYHAWYGKRATGRPAPGRNPVLKLASTIALAHHEWWDGTGYPRGLAGADIPLAARIAALADTYDALLSERPYKAACSEEQTMEIIRAECGRHLDPAVGAACERSAGGLRAIRNQFADPPVWAAATECMA